MVFQVEIIFLRCGRTGRIVGDINTVGMETTLNTPIHATGNTITHTQHETNLHTEWVQLESLIIEHLLVFFDFRSETQVTCRTQGLSCAMSEKGLSCKTILPPSGL